eukprot:TRINITY_DN14149_c0_g1_i1.p1 TRINITY_DN14149_c0_g1~~TRINITY_DN14149_c0_g1_i1.p1  ORF type:complete len:870 (+),score=229.31 TRINITY_DN14149_c0_g1_i1:2930-5539(+)
MSLPADKIKKRGNVVHEIFDTEEQYVQQLNAIISLYIGPLTTRKLIPSADIDKIFSNIEQIRDVNVKFLEGLREAIGDNRDFVNAVVGEPFLEIAPFFKVYTDYVNNQELSNKTLYQYRKNGSVKKLFKLNEDNPQAQGLDIESLLITPVQRIPRYKLLLEQLMKYTPDNHPDKKLIPEALRKTDEIAILINKAARDAADYLTLVDLQKQFQDEEKAAIAAFGRRLIKKGMLKKVCRSSDKEYTFFLFNDLLVYANGGSGLSQFKIHARIPVNRKFCMRDSPDTTTHQNRMEILSTVKSFIVIASDSISKQEWLHAYEELSANLEEVLVEKSSVLGEELVFEDPDEEAVAIWDPDEQARQCKICNQVFNVLRRKHHCRKCGDIVCGPCSRNNLVLNKKAFKGKSVRVCDRCFTSFQTTGEFPPSREKPNRSPLQSSMASMDGDPEFKGDDSGDELDTLGAIDSWFEAASAFNGSEETQEMTLRIGNRVSIQHRDSSGYWFGINLASHQVGWIDPAMLRQITVSSDAQQKQLEQALTYALSRYQNRLEAEDSPETSGKPFARTQTAPQSLTSSVSSVSTSSSSNKGPPLYAAGRQVNKVDAFTPRIDGPKTADDDWSSTSRPIVSAGAGLLAAVIANSSVTSQVPTSTNPSSTRSFTNTQTVPKSSLTSAVANRAPPRNGSAFESRQHSESAESDASAVAPSVASSSRTASRTPIGQSAAQSTFSSYSSIPKSVGNVGIASANSESDLSAYNHVSSAPVSAIRPANNRAMSNDPRHVQTADPRPVAETKVSEFKAPANKVVTKRIGETSGNNPKYKVVTASPGNAATKELQLMVGDIISVTKKDESGYWYGKSSKLEKSGWVDPANLEPI